MRHLAVRACFAAIAATGFVSMGAIVPAAPAWSAPSHVAPPRTPASAPTLVDSAVKRAAAGKKTVLVIFGASWCGWCHRLEDRFLADPEIHRLMAKHYEIVLLDVSENGEKKILENPGGADLQTELGGGRSGLPFYAFLDSAGKKIADSNVMANGNNIGYPSTPEEIDAFIALLRKTAPRLTDADAGRVTDYLKQDAQQRNGTQGNHA